ncbi:MAG: hypothetical protein EXQ69_03200 [Acidimicrobiia bacterium]|nr:hypothetical protein [Acidimicrobiia bacterium]
MRSELGGELGGELGRVIGLALDQVRQTVAAFDPLLIDGTGAWAVSGEHRIAESWLATVTGTSFDNATSTVTTAHQRLDHRRDALQTSVPTLHHRAIGLLLLDKLQIDAVEKHFFYNLARRVTR